MKLKKVKEGKAEIFIPTEEKISKKLPVFYNPNMKINRDLTLLLLKQYPDMKICDVLAGTGVRAIRIAKELKCNDIVANDLSENAFKLIKKNMKHNKVNFEVYNKDANILLLESKGFDYIDLDVFGCPNFVLDSAVKKLSRKGILAVTATDTSALSGTYKDACLRKYWALPLRNELKHEVGIRILIRKIQLIGAQYEKALKPIFSYSHLHYMRVFLECEKGKAKADDIIRKHGMFNGSGPVWLGEIWDKALVEKMYKQEPTGLLRIIKEESKISTVGFYDIHSICKRNKIPLKRKFKHIIEEINKRGYKASATHFSPYGIRSDIPEKELIKIIQ